MKKFLIGAIMGACAALLYAPQAGSQTRSQLKDKATKFGHDMEEMAQKKKRHFANKMDGYKHKMQDMADGLRSRGEREPVDLSV